MMYKALESKKLTDSAAVSAYARDALVMTANGIINGSNDRIDPKGLSTRAQAAVFLNRLLTNIEQ